MSDRFQPTPPSIRFLASWHALIGHQPVIGAAPSASEEPTEHAEEQT